MEPCPKNPLEWPCKVGKAVPTAPVRCMPLLTDNECRQIQRESNSIFFISELE